MTNTKWLRRALLGGVALSVMAAGAQADELSALKAQLESLQARVNTLETQPATTTMPDGTSLISFKRGQGTLANFGPSHEAADRGFTISVTPTADMPAPVAEIVVYGYVKGDVIYDFNHDLGDTFYAPSLTSGIGKSTDHIRLHARQTRFGIKSKVDTAIGQIRTVIEGDFFGSNGSGTSPNFRLRHAYGEWDITPNWTFLAGQTWNTAGLLPIGVTTVDFSGPVGPTYVRRAQVRLTYHDGPLSWAVAIQRPTQNTSNNNSTNMPDIAGYVQYDFPGGHQFIVTGDIADYSSANFDGVASTSNIGWVVQAGANINISDIAYLTTGVSYGYGQPQRGQFTYGGRGITTLNPNTGKTVEALGLTVGLSFNINDTTTFNTAFGYFDNLNNVAGANAANQTADVKSVHANIIWKPVSQLQMGWEVMWAQNSFVGGGSKSDVRAQFGTWFFF